MSYYTISVEAWQFVKDEIDQSHALIDERLPREVGLSLSQRVEQLCQVLDTLAMEAVEAEDAEEGGCWGDCSKCNVEGC